MLELAQLHCSVIPLPPPNYSQALLVGRIADETPADSVWSFLRRRYPVCKGMPEIEGARAVREMNVTYSRSKEFLAEYRQTLESFGPAPLPESLRARGDGVLQCVEVFEDLCRRMTFETSVGP